MDTVVTITEAKSNFSEIINRIITRKEKITITKKGRKVALLTPMITFKKNKEDDGLIRAKGTLADIDDSIDEMVDLIYAEREKEISREVNL
ncbi:MAG: Antitoxin [Acidobacteriota bacterium]|nr:Antitoxin [Acidobacteriota bacterium]